MSTLTNPIQEEIDASNGVPLLQPAVAAVAAGNQQLTEQQHHEPYVATQKTAIQRQNEGFVAFNKGFDDWYVCCVIGMVVGYIIVIVYGKVYLFFTKNSQYNYYHFFLCYVTHHVHKNKVR